MTFHNVNRLPWKGVFIDQAGSSLTRAQPALGQA